VDVDLGSIGDMQRYLQGINFPANKEEVASGAESNGAPQDFVDQIRNAATERFNGPKDVLQAVEGS
jgi:uncharacterized protein DUF2795